MCGYIYITTNKVNGKIYIGKRQKAVYDKSYYGSGKYLKRAIEKYGIENFENHIIEWCETPEKLNEREIYWIAKYNCNAKNKFGYNISKGGTGGNIYQYMSENRRNEIRKKIKEGVKGKNLGKKRSEETKRKIRDAMLNHLCSNEAKLKMSKSALNNTNRVGKKHSYESKVKMSESSSKKIKIVYNENLYEFKSMIEAISYFKESEISISNWFYRGVPKKYSKIFKIIE